MKRMVPILILGMAMFLTGCGRTTYQEYLEGLCDLYIDAGTVISDRDTHDDFHGDGVRMVIIDCTESSESLLLQLEEWGELPLSENLQLMLYGGTRDGIQYKYNLAEKYGIPEITNGCYFFLDRRPEAADSSSDAELLEHYPFNFSLVMYNYDTSALYLLEFDT